MEAFLLDLFVDVVNMSITASYVIMFVLVARLCLKKAPKIFSYSLWSVVLFRLVCPFSFSSALSLLHTASGSSGKVQYIPSNIGLMEQPQINTGIKGVDSAINASLPLATPYASANPMQIILFVLAAIWAAVIVALLLYSVISYLMLKRKVSTAMLAKDNIFESETISSPFVLGIINPKIYLPTGLKDTERSYILKHEQTHIRRFDHLIKPFAFLTLCVHWFNPLVWISFMLMTKDMEMSCDERVLKELGTGIKKDYSTSLLSLAIDQRMISASPLAFGESNIKARIKNVLNYRKPAFWVTVVAVIAVAGIAIGLISNPTPSFSDADYKPAVTTLEPVTPEWSPEQTIGADMAVLDYASDDMVIFHGYFGLYVYDLNTMELVRSLDLKPIKCNFTQGDEYCEVSVSMDGNTVQLHPINSDNMYVYTVSDHSLYETDYIPMDNAFGSQFVPIEEAVGVETGKYSYHAVQFDQFDTDNYGFLYTYDWTLGTLSYVHSDMMYALFQGEDSLLP